MTSSLKKAILVGLAGIVLAVSAGIGWKLYSRHLTFGTRIALRHSGAAATAPTTRPVEDWPQYRGPRGNGVSRETGVSSSLAGEGPAVVWSAEVGLGYSAPVAYAGRVYLFSLNNRHETLTAFDANSGQIAYSDEDPVVGWTGSYPGTRTAPVIVAAEDAVYTYGGSGNLLRRDLSTGKVRWRLNVLEATGTKNLQWGVASNPLVTDRLIYVQPGQGGAVAVAVDKVTGQRAWSSQFRGSGSYAQPVIVNVGGTRQLVVFCAEGPVGMNPETGATIWHQPWKTQYDVNAATPVYREPHLFITSGYDRGCMMLELTPAGATKLWEKKAITCKVNAPVLDPMDGHLYANSAGTIKCMSWPDGAIKWAAKESELRLGEGGSVVRVGADRLLSLSERGRASLLRATPEGYQLLWQAPVVEGTAVFSTPLLYGGRLYAKGTREFNCVDLLAGR